MSADIIDEVSGVYDATLKEDMMETVRRVKRPFIDCSIPDVFNNSQSGYPLVYVPSYLMTFPLHKGDKVKVYFNQNCLRYPVLWKLPDSYNSDFLKKLSFPSAGHLVKFPSAEKVIAVQQLNNDTFLYSTDKYVLIRTGDQFTLISPDGQVSNYTQVDTLIDTLNIEVKQNLTLEVNKKIFVKSMTDKIFIGNNIYDLYQALMELCRILKTGKTVGGPTTQSFAPDVVTAAATLEVLCKQVFE